MSWAAEHRREHVRRVRGELAVLTWTHIVAHQRKRLAACAAEWRALARAMGVPTYVDAARN